MSRNMIKANNYIFKVLAEFVQKSNIDVSIFGKDNHCIKTDDSEKEWLKNLKVTTTQQILPNFKTAAFEFENKQYFVAIGWHIYSETNQEAIHFIELNAGIVTALLFELKVSIHQKASPYDIADKIFYQSDEEIIKHDFALIADFFEPIFVYQIQDDSPFISEDNVDIIRLTGFYIIKNSQIVSLNFSAQTLHNFENLFIEGSTNIPYESLLFSLVSVYWKYSFLDVYRCIERLFCVSALEVFYGNLQISDSLLKFSTDVENYIGWKPKENEALNKLIDSSPEEALQFFREIKVFIDGTEEGRYGDLIYKIRNSIVHFRPATEQIQLDDANWDKLINSSLLVIEYWYHKYDAQLRM